MNRNLRAAAWAAGLGLVGSTFAQQPGIPLPSPAAPPPTVEPAPTPPTTTIPLGTPSAPPAAPATGQAPAFAPFGGSPAGASELGQPAGWLGRGMRSGMMGEGMPATSDPTVELAKKFAQSNTDGDGTNLVLALQAEFDRRIAAQEAEVMALEARVTKLRGQLDARKQAKGAIVQRRMEDLVNDAKGLGWPGGRAEGNVGGSGPMSGGRGGMSMGGGQPVVVLNPNDPRLSPRMKADAEEARRQGVKFMLNPELTAELAKSLIVRGPADANARAAAAAKLIVQNNLKQILIAMHGYHDAHGHFPRPDWRGPDGKAKYEHSWRVALLPFLEQKTLFDRYRLDEPWDSLANQAVSAEMPAVFGGAVAGAPTSSVIALVGPGLAWELGKELKLADFKDGTSNTALLAVGRKGEAWNKPASVEWAQYLDPSRDMALGMGDGSVQTLPANTPAASRTALFTRAGGEALPPLAALPGQFPVGDATPRP